MNCHFYSILRSNPFYEPKTSSSVKPQVGGPSLDMGSSQKRRAPPPPISSPGFGPSPSASKPSSVPDREQALAVGPSPVTAVIGRELASSSPKVTRLHLCDIIKTDPNVRHKKSWAVSLAWHFVIIVIFARTDTLVPVQFEHSKNAIEL